jgi:hypothetical protein
MGFGSYDESEQEQPTEDEEDDGEALNVHENEHKGDVSFDTEMSNTELVDQLQDMKGGDDE